MQRFYELGSRASSTATCSTRCPTRSTRAADAWLERQGHRWRSPPRAPRRCQDGQATLDRRRCSTRSPSRFLDAWEDEAGLETYGEAVAEVLEFRASEGEPLEMSVDEWRRFAARASLYAAREKAQVARRRRHLGLRARQDPRGLLPGPRRHPVRHRQVARRGALRRHALDGDQDRRPRRRARVRRGDPRRVPGQDARLQPLAVVQLGHHRHERRGDASASPRSSARWASSSTSSPTAATRSTASPPRSSPPPSSRTACSRSPACSARLRLVESPYRTPQTLVGGPRVDAALARLLGAHGDHQGDGQGLDPAPAPDPDRGAQEAARGVAGDVERALPAPRASCASSCGRTAPARSCSSSAVVRRRRREARQRRLRPHPGPPRPQHPLGARPEHLRRVAAQEAPDDARPPLAGAPLQGRLGALRHAHRGQPVPDREDEVARHLLARSTPRSARSSSPTSTTAASTSCSRRTGRRWGS